MNENDQTIQCSECSTKFTWNVREQEFYAQKNLHKPRRCPVCRKAAMKYINTDAITKFIGVVENQRGFKRDVRLVFAHLVEEVGELSRAIYLHERESEKQDYPFPGGIADELTDIIFLAIWLADILRINTNKHIPERMKDIKIQYDIKE